MGMRREGHLNRRSFSKGLFLIGAGMPAGCAGGGTAGVVAAMAAARQGGVYFEG